MDFIQGKINEAQYNEIYEKLLQRKQQRINKLNETRIGENILEDGLNYIKETRGGKNHPKFRKIKGKKIDGTHLKDCNSKQIYYKTHIKKKKKYQTPSNTKFPLEIISRRGNVIETER